LFLIWLRQNKTQNLEEEELEIAHPEVELEFIKKWWSLFSKVASAALPHNGKGLVKGEPLIRLLALLITLQIYLLFTIR